MNVLVLLQMAAEAMPARVAVKCGNEQLTYGELYQLSLAAAGVFQASGCDYVALRDTSSLATPVALFGAAAAGKPYVPINYRLPQQEAAALLARVEPAFFIAGDGYAEGINLEGTVRVESSESFIAACRNADVTDIDPWLIDSDTVSVQLFTSGTTGIPKAAVLRHRNLTAYILGSVEFASADESSAVLVSVPPYHIAGISALLSSIYAGRRIVLLPNFDPQQWLDLCEAESVTNAFVVPTMLSRIVEKLDDHNLEHAPTPALRAVAYGGGKMPRPVIESALQRFPNVDFTNAYGLTETSSTITLLTPEDHREALASDDESVRCRMASVGRPLPGVEIEVRDGDGMNVGVGIAGEIYVRGEQVSGEYVEKGSLLDNDGWFPTRDAGYFDDGGYLFLDGRADDVIVRGGENISPGEIEDLLLTHPAVKDSAVVGIPSTEWGEAVAAAVVLEPGHTIDDTELRELVVSELRSSRAPERFLFLDELPYNEMGKLLRRSIKPLFE